MGFKIKPKDFEKRRSMSKTYNDWNDENGSSVAYKGTRKRRVTVLDEVERCPPISLNQNPRIDGSETIAEACMKLSDGNPDTFFTLLGAVSDLSQADGLFLILNLDSMGVYGDQIKIIHDDAGNPAKFAEIVNGMRRGV